MSILQMSSFYGWSSPFVARLTEGTDLGFKIDQDEASWVVALMNVGRIFGAVIGAVLGQYFGSRKAVLLTFMPYALSWFFFMFANSVIWLYIARSIGGIGVGMGLCCFPLFIGEVALPKNRGAIVSIAFLGSPISNMITSHLGATLSFKDFSLVFLIPCILGFIMMLWMPDSPYYLVANGNKESAENSLRWYRAYDDVDLELKEVEEYVETSNVESFWVNLNKFRTVAFLRKGIFIVIMLFIIAQITGMNSIMMYTETILIDVKFHLIDRPKVATYAYAITIIFTLISAYLIEKCGRRILEVISLTGALISLIILATLFLLIRRYGVSTEKLQWLPIISIFIYQASLSIGMINVSSTVLGEIFPSNLKNTAGCLASMAGAIFGFLSAKTYQPLVKNFGEDFVYYGEAGFALAGIIFTLVYLPETKGKSLQQIQEKFLGNKHSNIEANKSQA